MEIIKIKNKEPRTISADIGKIIDTIKKGGVVVFPTDTVYGLLSDATNKKAVAKLLRIKRRRRGHFLPLFVKNLRDAKKNAQIDAREESFLKIFWPGQITVVLKRKKGIKLYGVDKKTIALRIPDFPLLNSLLKKITIPLTATSANISGKMPSGKIKEVLKQFSNSKYRPDLAVNVGPLPKRKSSIIIDLTKDIPKLLRM
ncbi:MAG: L-threonylcarbamoyladenylate synthase [Patescibacteria group bacterium]